MTSTNFLVPGFIRVCRQFVSVGADGDEGNEQLVFNVWASFASCVNVLDGVLNSQVMFSRFCMHWVDWIYCFGTPQSHCIYCFVKLGVNFNFIYISFQKVVTTMPKTGKDCVGAREQWSIKQRYKSNEMKMSFSSLIYGEV